MKTTHTIAATYPLAGSENGLPVEIKFTYEPIPEFAPTISFQSVRPVSTWAEPLPMLIRSAIEAWAQEWLDDDEGYPRAWDVALDDTERQRESARDMGMVRK